MTNPTLFLGPRRSGVTYTMQERAKASKRVWVYLEAGEEARKAQEAQKEPLREGDLKAWLGSRIRELLRPLRGSADPAAPWQPLVLVDDAHLLSADEFWEVAVYAMADHGGEVWIGAHAPTQAKAGWLVRLQASGECEVVAVSLPREKPSA